MTEVVRLELMMRRPLHDQYPSSMPNTIPHQCSWTTLHSSKLLQTSLTQSLTKHNEAGVPILLWRKPHKFPSKPRQS